MIAVPPDTERPRFRAMGNGDLDRIAALLGDPEVMTYYPAPKTREQIGFHVRTEMQGNGLATEAAATCRDFARTISDMNELVAIIHPHNAASRRVAEKIGMHFDTEERTGSPLVRDVFSMTLPRAPRVHGR